jgi:Sap-like sulfolipid-1-addressing protein
VGWIDLELALVALAAMLSPTTLTFSILTLVLSSRPLRSGFWFYVGALTATLGIGVLAALVLGNVAASDQPSSPKTWVAILDVIAGAWLIVWVVGRLRKPRDPRREEGMRAQIEKVANSPAIAIVGAGAILANPGGFIPLALKEISELDPSRVEYVVDWVFFAVVSLLPLAIALVLLVLASDWTKRVLESARRWLDLHVRTIAAVILLAVAAALLRNGIAGLTG